MVAEQSLKLLQTHNKLNPEYYVLHPWLPSKWSPKKESCSADDLQLILFGEPHLLLFSGYLCAYYF